MCKRVYIKKSELTVQAGPDPAGKPDGFGADPTGRSPGRTDPVVPDPDTSDRVFAYICAYLAQQGYPPSMRDIGHACQLSLGGVVYNLGKLEDRGWLTHTPHVARSLRVVWVDQPGQKSPNKIQNICAISYTRSMLD